jgi:hypothetical protein
MAAQLAPGSPRSSKTPSSTSACQTQRGPGAWTVEARVVLELMAEDQARAEELAPISDELMTIEGALR